MLSNWIPYLQSGTCSSYLPTSSSMFSLNGISLLRALFRAPRFVPRCLARPLCSSLAYLASFPSPQPFVRICLAILSVLCSRLSMRLCTSCSFCYKCLPSVFTWLILFRPSLLSSNFIPSNHLQPFDPLQFLPLPPPSSSAYLFPTLTLPQLCTTVITLPG